MRIVIQIDTGDETPTVITDTGAAPIPPWPTVGSPANQAALSETALPGGPGGPYQQPPGQSSTAPSPDLSTKAETGGAVDGGSAPSSPIPDNAPHPFTTDPSTPSIFGSDIFRGGQPAELAVDVSAGPAPDMDRAGTGETEYLSTSTASGASVQTSPISPQQIEDESEAAQKKPDRKRKK